MKMKCKAVMFLTLLIFCVGSVCAAEPDNSTIDNYNSTQDFKDIRVLIDNLEKNDANQAKEIQKLKDNNTQLDKRVKALEDSNKQKDVDIKELKDSNKQLVDSNKQLIESNKVLSDRLDKKDLEIQELNVKLDNQSNEINKLNDDIKQAYNERDKLRSEKEELYKQLLSSDENRTFLKNELKNKDIQINELNIKINELNNEIEQLKDANNELKALNISYGDAQKSIKWVTDYIQQHNKKPATVKCGATTFKINDYLNLLFVKVGKAGINIFHKEHGRQPNYLTIAGYKVPKNVYQKLYNL